MNEAQAFCLRVAACSVEGGHVSGAGLRKQSVPECAPLLHDADAKRAQPPQKVQRGLTLPVEQVSV